MNNGESCDVQEFVKLRNDYVLSTILNRKWFAGYCCESGILIVRWGSLYSNCWIKLDWWDIYESKQLGMISGN